MARSGKKRDFLAFSATLPHRGPNREMASFYEAADVKLQGLFFRRARGGRGKLFGCS
jgi:hypothetical protein